MKAFSFAQLRAVLALALAFSMASGMSACAPKDKNKTQISKAEKARLEQEAADKAKAEDDAKSLETKLAQTQAEVDKMRAQLSEFQNLASERDAIRDSRAQLTKDQAAYEEANKKLQAAQAELEKAKADFQAQQQKAQGEIMARTAELDAKQKTLEATSAQLTADRSSVTVDQKKLSEDQARLAADQKALNDAKIAHAGVVAEFQKTSQLAKQLLMKRFEDVNKELEGKIVLENKMAPYTINLFGTSEYAKIKAARQLVGALVRRNENVRYKDFSIITPNAAEIDKMAASFAAGQKASYTNLWGAFNSGEKTGIIDRYMIVASPREIDKLNSDVTRATGGELFLNDWIVSQVRVGVSMEISGSTRFELTNEKPLTRKSIALGNFSSANIDVTNPALDLSRPSQYIISGSKCATVSAACLASIRNTGMLNEKINIVDGEGNARQVVALDFLRTIFNTSQKQLDQDLSDFYARQNPAYSERAPVVTSVKMRFTVFQLIGTGENQAPEEMALSEADAFGMSRLADGKYIGALPIASNEQPVDMTPVTGANKGEQIRNRIEIVKALGDSLK